MCKGNLTNENTYKRVIVGFDMSKARDLVLDCLQGDFDWLYLNKDNIRHAIIKIL